MSWNYLLLCCWRFQINGTNERLNKVAFLMNHLNNTMKRICCPTENFSLDESVVLWWGRLIFRQYIKGKKHKYGVKVYKFCESDGLLLRSFIYSLPNPGTHDLGQTDAIVLKLMEDFLRKGCSVFADNFYNSVKLAKHLSKQKTYICGTLHGDRKVNPKDIEESWRKENLRGKGAMILLFVSGRKNATCWPFLITTVLKWSSTQPTWAAHHQAQNCTWLQ